MAGINFINPTDLSYNEYIKAKEECPLFFWNHKRNDWDWNNVFIGRNAETNNVAIGYSALQGIASHSRGIWFTRTI